ncbi:CCR4-NOT transcription complex subunit 11 [Teleopsis dalmanni]|uniref:CCR4-NOT transcription complex subunit 11 n=1 Tax=Teleopsis dalmanni TaxID=139649 RepID=UPI0018CD1814|nr:CCR4-NOT transcription complex subunit 11 [Teleopsis dalmanni]
MSGMSGGTPIPNLNQGEKVFTEHEPDELGQPTEEICTLKNALTPEILTVAPPLMDFEDELVWFDLISNTTNKILYDNTDCIDASLKNLCEQAYLQPLIPQDQKLLLEELTKNENFVHQFGLTSEKLPQLVENNPLISVEILTRLVNTTQMAQYFRVLVDRSITLHSMEVVNRLTTLVNLPPEFINLYISNCISTCETVTDKYMQARLVRLVCVFLQSLIRNKIIDVKALSLEIEAFCVGHNRVKEAVGLYRLLKHLDTAEQNLS